MRNVIRPLAALFVCLALSSVSAQMPPHGGMMGPHGGMSGPPRGPNFTGGMGKLFGNNGSFSATMEVQAEGMPANQAPTGKIAVDMGKSCFEVNVPGNDPRMAAMGMDKMVMISRPDKQVTYTVFPGMNAYIETPMPNPAAAKPESDYKIEVTELGKETVDGHPCVKNKAVVTDDAGNKTESTLWNATDLKDFPVKIETAQGGQKSTMLFKNVKLEKPDAALFDPPADDKKYDNMMSLMMERMGGGMGGGMGGKPPHGE